MKLSRRGFIVKGSVSLLALYLAGHFDLLGKVSSMVQAAGGSHSNGDPILVIIQLSGGNDGLNTLVPYGIGAYYDQRPTLGIPEKEVLHLDKSLGLHPSLAGLKQLFDQKKLAIIRGVGYPNPNRSHFRSMEIWQTADPTTAFPKTGWLGRYLDLGSSSKESWLKGITVGAPSKIFMSERFDSPVINDVAQFKLLVKGNKQDQVNKVEKLRQMYQFANSAPISMVGNKGVHAFNISDQVQAKIPTKPKIQGYPEHSPFASQLELISAFIRSGIGTRVFFAGLGGFDDHAHEKESHAKLLKQLDEGVSAFYRDLESQGVANRVTTLMYSEFGRRVKENASGGTDHGTAAPVFVLGGNVKGGFYGEESSLTNLDNGDLKYTVDFRSVYATVIDKCLRVPHKEILGKTFDPIKFI